MKKVTLFLALLLTCLTGSYAQCIRTYQHPDDTVISQNTGLMETIGVSGFTDTDFSVLAGLPAREDHVFSSKTEEGGNGARTGPVLFTTACPPVANFIENFDNVETPALPECWSQIERGPNVSQSSADISTTEYEPQTAPNCVEFYTPVTLTDEDDIILVSPNLSTLAAGNHRLRFYAKGNNIPDGLQVGTLDNNTSTANFSTFEEFPVTKLWTEYIIDFSDYSGTDTYVGLRFVTSYDHNVIDVDNFIWEPIPTCPDVSEVAVPAVATDGATFTWVSNGSENTWDVAVGPSSVSDPGALTFVTSNDVTKTISGLTADTNYYVWVRSVCSGNDNGAWIGPVAFKTDCLPVADFFEDFDTTDLATMPDCWTAIIRGPSLTQLEEIGVLAYHVHSDPLSIVLFNGFSSPDENDIILVSPNLSSLSAGTHRVRFWAKGSESESESGSGYIQVGTLDSNTDAAVFNMIDEIEITDTPTQYTVDFTSYAGADHYIGFRMNAGEDDSPAFYLDDIRWEVPPSCPGVTDLLVSDVTISGAVVSWTPDDSETAWEVGYADGSVTVPTGITTTLPATTPSLELTGLTESMEYNVWVRSVCSGSDYSAWTGPYGFTTKCTPTSVPYSENFELVSVPDLPDCSTTVYSGPVPNNWKTTEAPGYGFDSTAMAFTWDGFETASALYFTRGINLTAGTTYVISYRYGNDTLPDEPFPGYVDSLTVFADTDPSPGEISFSIGYYLNINDAQAHEDTITFEVPETGVYYFGFLYAYGGESNQNHFFVDDIKVDSALSTNIQTIEGIDYYPNPVKDVLNLTYTQNISGVAVYNLLGQKVLENTINANTAKVDVSGLSAGSYIVKVTANEQTKTIKVIKE